MKLMAWYIVLVDHIKVTMTFDISPVYKVAQFIVWLI